MHTQTTNRQSMGNTQTINVKTNETGTCAEREEKKGEEKKKVIQDYSIETLYAYKRARER